MLLEYETRLFGSMISQGMTPLEISKQLSIDVTTVRRKLHKLGINFKI